MFNMESRHLLNLSVQNALDCISESFNLKHFPGKACARNSLEKCAVRRPDERYIAPILPLYTISLGPLYHKIFRPPLKQHLIFQRHRLAYKCVNSLAPTYFRERPIFANDHWTYVRGGQLDATPGELSSGFLRV